MLTPDEARALYLEDLHLKRKEILKDMRTAYQEILKEYKMEDTLKYLSYLSKLLEENLDKVEALDEDHPGYAFAVGCVESEEDAEAIYDLLMSYKNQGVSHQEIVSPCEEHDYFVVRCLINK